MKILKPLLNTLEIALVAVVFAIVLLAAGQCVSTARGQVVRSQPTITKTCESVLLVIEGGISTQVQVCYRGAPDLGDREGADAVRVIGFSGSRSALCAIGAYPGDCSDVERVR